MKIKMKMKKQTKNTVVYEVNNQPITSVYIKKSSLPNTPPRVIELELTYEGMIDE